MYVIFDMDGVIVDSEAVYLAGYLHAARLYDLPIEDMRAAVGRAVGVVDAMERAIMTETFGHLPQFSLDKTYKACRDYFNNAVETGQIDLYGKGLWFMPTTKNGPFGLSSTYYEGDVKALEEAFKAFGH